MTPIWLVVVLVAVGAFAPGVLVYTILVARQVAAMRREGEEMTREVITAIEQGDEEKLRSFVHERR